MGRRTRGRQRYNVEEHYYHEDCGFTYSVWRKHGDERGKDHLKKLFCPRCMFDVNFKKRDKITPFYEDGYINHTTSA